MTVKRLRMSRSSSNLLAESSTVTERSSPQSEAQPRGKAMKVSEAAGNKKTVIQASVGAEKEKFYEKCYNCENKIGKGDAVFMYSYLRAFCCEDCRDDQMEQDKMFGTGSSS